jgi:hypothetical protein
VPNDLNQIASFGGTAFYWYPAGGLEADATAQYVWNSENELVGIGVQKTGAIYGFGYDGLGRRTVIASGANGAMTTYMNYGWCGRHLCQLRDGSNNPVRRYLAEGEVRPRPVHQMQRSLRWEVKQLLDRPLRTLRRRRRAWPWIPRRRATTELPSKAYSSHRHRRRPVSHPTTPPPTMGLLPATRARRIRRMAAMIPVMTVTEATTAVAGTEEINTLRDETGLPKAAAAFRAGSLEPTASRKRS